MTVERKVDESFGSSLTGEWLEGASPEKEKRLADLRQRLGLSRKRVDHIWYQLIQRTAAALIEAERFSASTSVMLVHSFSQDNARFEDYWAFVELFGKSVEPDTVTFIGRKNGIALYTEWVVGEPEFLAA